MENKENTPLSVDSLETEQPMNYSRSARSTDDFEPQETGTYKVKVLGRHRWYLLLISLLLGAINIGLPILSDLASLSQSQNLYTGLMLTKGLLPYGDIFATGGILYYAMIAGSYLLGTSAWLVLPQALAFYLSGVYFYRLVAYFTRKVDLALVATCLFYMLNAGLGFGGLYPIQFALPMVLIGLWFLTKYFDHQAPDEAFILYGFIGALSILLEPRTLIFWVLSALFTLVFNIRRKEKGRGVYQLLCMIFGSLLVFYSSAYFLINLQILGPYMSQGLVYHLTTFIQGRESLSLSLPLQVALAAAGGLLTGAVLVLKQLKSDAAQKTIKWFLLIMLFVSLPYALLSQTFEAYFLLEALVYGLLLTVVWFHQRQETEQSVRSHRRVQEGQFNGKLFSQLLKSHFYLPLLVVLFGVA